MYKGLSRLGILTIILSLLLVPGGLGYCGGDEWRGICNSEITWDRFSYTYSIKAPNGLTYAADAVEFKIHVQETEQEFWEEQHHYHSLSSPHGHSYTCLHRFTNIQGVRQ